MTFFLFSSSSLLATVFVNAAAEKRKLKVIVADGRPKFEGKEMVRRLVNMGLHCTYVLVSSVPYIIQEVWAGYKCTLGELRVFLF